MATLRAFLKHPRAVPEKRTRCWTCQIPEREEVDAVLSEHGVSLTMIAKWLQERGYEDTTYLLSRRLYNHRAFGHIETVFDAAVRERSHQRPSGATASRARAKE